MWDIMILIMLIIIAMTIMAKINVGQLYQDKSLVLIFFTTNLQTMNFMQQFSARANLFLNYGDGDGDPQYDYDGNGDDDIKKIVIMKAIMVAKVIMMVAKKIMYKDGDVENDGGHKD